MLTLQRNKKPQSLEERHEEILKQSSARGKAAGMKSLPSQGQGLEHYFKPIAAQYRELLAIYSPPSDSDASLAELERKTVAEKQKATQERLRKLNNKLLQLNNEKELTPEADAEGKSQWWVFVLILCAALCEAGYSLRAISLLEGGSNMVRIVSFIILTVIFMALPHVLLKIYRSTQNHPSRFVVWGVVGAMILSAFIGLSVMRSAYVEHLDATTLNISKVANKVTVHPAFFLLVQVFLIALSTFAASFLNTSKEKNEMKDAKKLHASIEATELEIRKIEAEINGLPDRSLHTERVRLETAAKSAANAARIRSYYEQSIGAFIEANTMFRNDDYIIDMSQPFPEL